MQPFDLLTAVQPSDGWFAVVGISSPSGQRTQKLTEDRAEVDVLAKDMMMRGLNVFYGVAKYNDPKKAPISRKTGRRAPRSKDNVRALKAFWVDLDCGTNKPYATQADGLTALMQFCKLNKLPKPILVNSGYGIHAYWPLTSELTRAEWEPAAESLKAMCLRDGLQSDPTCFEVARILRLPDTVNFKGAQPVPVTVLQEAGPTDTDAFLLLLNIKLRPSNGAAPAVLPTITRKRGLSPMMQAVADEQTKKDASFRRILEREPGCAQLVHCVTNAANLSEPLWRSALSIAKECTDEKMAVLAVSAADPRYSKKETELKLEGIAGPHSCEQFETHNPGGCKGCPFAGTITTPLQLGRDLPDEESAAAEIIEKDQLGLPVVYTVPNPPFPYERRPEGGIVKPPKPGEEKDPILVYENDLYVAERMTDPNHGDVIVMRLHLPKDGVREFTIPNSDAADATAMRKILASKGVVCSRRKFDAILDYVTACIKSLQKKRKAQLMRTQFGWADNYSKFIVGDREFTKDGGVYSPPSSATKPFADNMGPTGSFEKWKEVFDLYGRPGLEAQAFAAATTFGAPLLHMSGQKGAAINVIHPRSGTGKTTVLHMANSVWGDPAALCARKDDTFNSKMLKLGIYNNLIICFDEMTNTPPLLLSELLYMITQGSGKDRMKAATNELRINLTTWQTIALCSSNKSFYEILAANKHLPEGEIMRTIEIHLDYLPKEHMLDVAYAKDLFDEQLLHNYGHAGHIYAQWLVNNYELAKKWFKEMQSTIDKLLNITQRERYWSAIIAANLTGIRIARRLGLCNWDLKAIYEWAKRLIETLRAEVTPPPENDASVIGDYINANVGGLLVVNANADRRTKMCPLPEVTPKQALRVRHEPDTKKTYIAYAPFAEDCARKSINLSALKKSLMSTGMLEDTKIYRIAKGMDGSSPPVRCWVFDANHPDMKSMDDLEVDDDEPAEADAS